MAEQTDKSKDAPLTFNKAEKGKSGTDITSGVYQEEYLNALTGPNGHEVYNRMRRSDTQVRKILAAITSPIKSAKWFIEPVSDDTKDIEVAALLSQIFFNDMDYTHKLGEILTSLAHGFSIFEVIHQNITSKEFGTYTGIANLAFRSQASITEWKHDPRTGKLLEVHQEMTGDIEVDVWLKAENLLIFFNEKEGDNAGFSILRPLYGAWKRKQLIETLKMIGIERSAIPTPTLEVPADISVDDEQYKQAVALLEGFTSAENSFITFPTGWVLDLHQNGGFDPMKLEDAIKREDEKMAGAILATFLELGTGGNGGAYALGENLERFFTYVVESFARVIINNINEKLIPSLVRMNYGDAIEKMPKLEFSGISNRVGKEFMEIITGYTNAGVVQKDELLEDYVRRVHNLPKKVEGDMLENQESQEDQDESTDDGVGDNSDDDNSSGSSTNDGTDDKVTQLSETIQLADEKTPKGLITNEAAKVSEVMRDNLKLIGDKLVADITRKYKQLPEKQKLKAIDNIKIGGTAKYKRQLKGSLTTTSRKALDQAKAEAPVEADVKLKNNEEFFALLDNYGTVKFQDSDFSSLPAHVRKLIQLQSTRIVDRQANEIEDRVAFSFMQTEQTTNDYAVIEADMQEVANQYVEGASIDTAATNTASTLINQTRNEYFFAPEVIEELYAFKFINSDPKAAICRKLAGKVFSTNDREFLQYSPPLHHNCKSYLGTVLQSSKNKPTIEPLPPLTKEDRKSVTLSEYLDRIFKEEEG